MTQSELKILMSPAEKAWLRHQAKTESRTMNAILLRLIADAMKDNPLRVCLREVTVFDAPTIYCVSVGVEGRALLETPDRDAAIAFARQKIADLGLPTSALAYHTADMAA